MRTFVFFVNVMLFVDDNDDIIVIIAAVNLTNIVHYLLFVVLLYSNSFCIDYFCALLYSLLTCDIVFVEH